MDGNEFGEVIVSVIEARLSKRGELTLTLSGLKALIREALHPGGYKAFERPKEPDQLPVAPEYPKLKVRYDRITRRPLEHKVIHDIREEIPYMSGGWYTRPVSELKQLEGESR